MKKSRGRGRFGCSTLYPFVQIFHKLGRKFPTLLLPSKVIKELFSNTRQEKNHLN
jgi:hypothetical protein